MVVVRCAVVPTIHTGALAVSTPLRPAIDWSLEHFVLLIGIVLLLAAGIIFLLLAFRQFFRREQARQVQAAVVSSAELFPTPPPQELAPLSVGASIGGGRYTIVEVRDAAPEGNLYHVQDTMGAGLCPTCHLALPATGLARCPSCGADLVALRPLPAIFRVHERAEGTAFLAAERLLQLPFYHPAVSLPLAVFTETVGDTPRRYLVLEEPASDRADGLPRPQPLWLVLQWGIQLAQGLAALHRHGVVLGRADLNQIAIRGMQAQWRDLSAACFFACAAGEEFRAGAQRDVCALVSSLWTLLDGKESVAPIAGLPPGVNAFFHQALAAAAPPATANALAVALLELLARVGQLLPPTPILGQRSHVGRKRALNEDASLAMQTLLLQESAALSLALLAVADGMGGHQAGEVSSRMAVAAVAERAEAELFGPAAAGRPLPDPRSWVESAIRAANRAVWERRQATGTDMGTTLVVALLIGDRAVIGNVGDSRAYRLGAQGITQLTVDHSLVQRLVESGQISAERARTHPGRNVIYRSVGERPDIEVDLAEQQLQPGEALLVCSDGLNSMLTDPQIWETWKGAFSPQEACEQLVEAANAAGGEDNITVVVAHLHGT